MDLLAGVSLVRLVDGFVQVVVWPCLVTINARSSAVTQKTSLRFVSPSPFLPSILFYFVLLPRAFLSSLRASTTPERDRPQK
ncbi:uncharacterized protein BJ212DRAFT_1076130 [Suillus subaureus]|uniref:Uncharacterized protein n=1 Tax=Suillus subaureus TaxID=48587 RepID=A0A9P7DRD9_9AGAM|nr:uncharacterized protein BJ212DRAFT_1076130 [Suillus subaureus]KAG1801254.1 hypothetical protein BJ212DRAFT_1076130 [Suillus subaureus]